MSFWRHMDMIAQDIDCNDPLFAHGQIHIDINFVDISLYIDAISCLWN